jgi:hypothetical protein
LVEVQHNPVPKASYQRLLNAGKPRRLALTAAMRKLLVILNAISQNSHALERACTIEKQLSELSRHPLYLARKVMGK